MLYYWVFLILFIAVSSALLALKKSRSLLWEDLNQTVPICKFPQMEYSRIKFRYDIKDMVLQNDGVYKIAAVKMFRVGRLTPRRVDPAIMFFLDKKELKLSEIDSITNSIKSYTNSFFNRLFGIAEFHEYSDDGGVLLVIIGLIPRKEHLQKFGIWR